MGNCNIIHNNYTYTYIGVKTTVYNVLFCSKSKKPSKV